MSSTAVPVPPFEFAQQGDFSDNYTYTVPASGEVQPYTATATFANSSGQAIQPTISIYSAEGNLLARVFPVGTVADGATAEVTWMPPFGSAASSSGTGSGLQFDTSPQVGDWLEVTTSGHGGSANIGTYLADAGGFGIIFFSQGGFIDRNVQGDDNSGITDQVYGADNSGINMKVHDSDNGGFFVSVDDGDNGISLSEGAGDSGGINVKNEGSGGVTVSDFGTGVSPGITLKSTPADGSHPQIQLLSPGIAGEPTWNVGGGNAAIINNGTFDSINVWGGQGHGSLLNYVSRINLAAATDTVGNTDPHPEAIVIGVSPQLRFDALLVEPNIGVSGDTSMLLYVYDDLSGHPQLKYYFPGTGARGTLATG